MTNKQNAGVIGWPIKHSRSPLIHTHWLKTYEIEGSYQKFSVAPENLKSFIASLKANGLGGLNVTIPYKEEVFGLADQVTDEAKSIGAANTLWFEDEKLVAGNTDAYGFITHLTTTAPTWQKTKPAMILGAGGAARAILYALVEKGVREIRICNRTMARAEQLAEKFKNDSARAHNSTIKVFEWQQRNSAINECSLIVNSTSLGMQGGKPLELSLDRIADPAVIFDIVYAPLETDLLKSAKQHGHTIVDGVGMLLHQAVPGFKKWFGVTPTVTNKLRDLLVDDLTNTK